MDFLFHLVVPYSLLRVQGFSNRYLLPLLPLAILPDLDRFAWARRSGHSLLVGLALVLAIWLLTRHRPDGRRIAFISGFYFFSHLALDLGGEMAWLWPLDPTYYIVIPYLKLVNLWPVFGIEFHTMAAVQQGIGTVLSAAGFGTLALLLVLWAVKQLRKR